MAGGGGGGRTPNRRPCGHCNGCAAAAARAARTRELGADERLLKTVFMNNVYAMVEAPELVDKLRAFGEVPHIFLFLSFIFGVGSVHCLQEGSS